MKLFTSRLYKIGISFLHPEKQCVNGRSDSTPRILTLVLTKFDFSEQKPKLPAAGHGP